jgi:cysteine synthase A
MKLNHILESIGQTPHLKINRLYAHSGSEVWMKCEKQNPGGSIKDRIALAMVEDAEKSGQLKAGSVIIEPTSGNTGIGLAMVSAVKGYRCVLVMPESMSIERRKIMKAYGAEFVLTPREKGMKGAIEKAKELLQNEYTGQQGQPQGWIPSQFDNISNVSVHVRTTAQEILKDFPHGFDYLITGVGTGGHITGVGRELKKKFPKLKIIAVEPALSPVLSGGAPGPHPIQGIDAGFVPSILDRSVIDEVVTDTKEDAFLFAQRAAREEGFLGGVSTGATLAAIDQVLKNLATHSSHSTLGASLKILGFNYDTGERYLSIEGLFPET